MNLIVYLLEIFPLACQYLIFSESSSYGFSNWTSTPKTFGSISLSREDWIAFTRVLDQASNFCWLIDIISEKFLINFCHLGYHLLTICSLFSLSCLRIVRKKLWLIGLPNSKLWQGCYGLVWQHREWFLKDEMKWYNEANKWLQMYLVLG